MKLKISFTLYIPAPVIPKQQQKRTLGKNYTGFSGKSLTGTKLICTVIFYLVIIFLGGGEKGKGGLKLQHLFSSTAFVLL